MKVSLNWLKQFTGIEAGIDEITKKIGSQLGEIEEVVDYGARYKDIVVGVITDKQYHKNADKLAVYKVDAGEGEAVQVVSGDTEIQVGDKVAWIRPGAVVPSTFETEPFTLESRELRGEISHGMFGSGAELCINGDHDKVLVLDTAADSGTPFAEAYELNDYIIDIENKMFTHRPDCFGILGVAREVAGIYNQQFESPEWYTRTVESLNARKTTLPLEVRNEIPKLVPRFMLVALSDVQVRPSPLIMQSYLNRVGIKPINNIVDITNYMMMLTAQPMHAYDYDKIRAHDLNADKAIVIVRKPNANESIKLLNGKTIKMREDAIVIASAFKPIGLGGVMGSADTEVDESTKNILLECATFDMYSIRRTSMQHGLFTDAVTRFNKGQSPWQNEGIMAEAAAMIRSVAHAEVASELFDEKADLAAQKPLDVTVEFINSRLGLDMTAEQIASRLGNVEFDVVITGDTLTITPPFWRTDIHIPEDIVEEVGRLTGYDTLPKELPKRLIEPTERNSRLDFHSRIRSLLSSYGANEVLSYSFVHGNLLSKVGQDPESAFRLTNALSPDLQYYRLSLLPSLLDKVYANIRADYYRPEDNNEFVLFEINKVHIKGAQDVQEQEVPREFDRLALTFAADEKTASKKYAGASYYMALNYLDELLGGLNISYEVTPAAKSEPYPSLVPVEGLFSTNRKACIKIGGEIRGYIGEYKASVRKALKLPDYCAGFELDITGLSDRASKQAYEPMSKYPKSVQDITLQISNDHAYKTLEDEVAKQIDSYASERSVSTHLSVVDIYQAPDAATRNITFRVWVASHERTMTTQELNLLLDQIAASVLEKYSAQRI